MDTAISATTPESAERLPGDELVPRAHQSTRGISIAATPRDTWRWLQTRLHSGPIAPGDGVRAGPPGHPSWKAVQVEYAKALVLQAPGASWAFVLRSLDQGKGTRLVVRTRMPDDPLSKLVIDPVEWIFERRMLLAVREKAEREELS